MTDDACQRYAQDPEAHAGHLAVCERCREIDDVLSTPVVHRPIAIEALPLAPWEEAGYRAWPLVAGGAVVVLAVAFALCAAAGISIVQALATGVRSDGARAVIDVVDQKLRPFGPFVFAALFLIVNTILVLLLRRAPRGIDA